MTRESTTLKQAKHLIQSARFPLLICHINPDGDAVGSLTGLGRALCQMEPRSGRSTEPTLTCASSISPNLDYIPGVEAIVQEVNSPFDLVIALDCSDLNRVDHFTEMPNFGRQPLLNIDHHVTNTGFGDVNLVNPQASSTSEIVLRLLEYMELPIDADIATSLLAGIVTDTRGFRTSNVTSQVMDAALRLMKAGAALPYITQHGLDRRSTVAIRLWGAALSRLRLEKGMIWTSISLAMRRSVGYTGNGDAGLASFLISADDADVSVVFGECEDDRVEVALRAKPGWDVAQLAFRFGGGGHALAAGFNIAGPLPEARDRVLTALHAELARQRQDYA